MTRPFSVCGDEMLGYRRSRTDFVPGTPFLLDESYRLAHLPLVAPSHPDVIPRAPGKDYEMGCHGEVFSLVLPIDPDMLEAAPAWRELVAALQAAPFAPKIAWDLLPRRRSRLHATVCGGLGTSGPAISDELRELLRRIGPIGVELRGLFSGNVNRGRLYLKLHPEQRDGANSMRALQRAFGRAETDLYVVGMFNLADHLDPMEAAALASLIERWWDRPLLRFLASELWLLGSRDDLVLDSRIVERVPLV